MAEKIPASDLRPRMPDSHLSSQASCTLKTIALCILTFPKFSFFPLCLLIYIYFNPIFLCFDAMRSIKVHFGPKADTRVQTNRRTRRTRRGRRRRKKGGREKEKKERKKNEMN